MRKQLLAGIISALLIFCVGYVESAFALNPNLRQVVLAPSLEQQVRAILKKSGGSLYLPSPSTCFTDSAGTIPCTVDDPVGFLMDTGQGGLSNLGPELVTNGDFSNGATGWTLQYSSTIAVVTGEMQLTVGTSQIQGRFRQQLSTVIGKTYRISGTYRSGQNGKNVSLKVSNNSNLDSAYLNSTVNNTTSNLNYSGYFTATATTTYIGGHIDTATQGNTAYFDNISVQELPGNHATQATTADKPILRQTSGRYWMDMADGTDKLTVLGLSGYTASTLIHSVLGTGQTTLENQDISAGYNWTQDNSAGLIICRTAPSPRDLALMQRYMNKLAGV
jgi:hypothetical protein